MRALGEHGPKLKFAIAWFWSNSERFVQTLPFRRHWVAIGIVGTIFEQIPKYGEAATIYLEYPFADKTIVRQNKNTLIT